MANSSEKDIFFSFFMFTADLRPNDPTYTQTIIVHLKALKGFGYTGFDLPIAPTDLADPKGELASYRKLRQAIDDAGLEDVKFTTNVAVTRTFDPSSPFAEQRALGLSYLQSRVDISKALRAEAMAGPIVMPYGVFPTTDGGAEIWSDALQDAVVSRYHNAQPILESLGQYAAEQGVKIAIEPVDHWETPAPTLVRDVMDFIERIPCKNVGVCVDSAHVVLGSDGPAAFTHEVDRLSTSKRIHYVHISAPDRGAVHGSWIPWKPFLKPILKSYEGPFLVEVFNAIPVFLHGLRITRRKFLIPGEDTLDPKRLNAYDIAEKGIAAVRHEISAVHTASDSESGHPDDSFTGPATLQNAAKPEIIGSWKLVSWRRIQEDGTVSFPFGEEVIGTLLYAADLTMTVQMLVKNRPTIPTTDALGGTDDQRAAAYSTCLAYFGTYEVQADLIVHKVEGSLFPNWSGTVQDRPFAIDGDELALRTPPGPVVNEITWTRHQTGKNC